jgi:putative metalloprotease
MKSIVSGLTLIVAVMTSGAAMGQFSLGNALGGLGGMLGGNTTKDQSTNLLGALSDLTKAANITDEDVNVMAFNFSKQSDEENKIAPETSIYAKRLLKLTSKWENYDGMKLDFKVYMSDTVNAFALSNGTVRVYSGLMDLMTDDELRFVIGHEIGHVKLGHSTASVKNAYQSSALVKGAAAAAGSNSNASMVMNIAGDQLKGIMEKVLTSAHSRGQESDSDAYALKFLKASKTPAKAATSALLKLAGNSGERSVSLMSSHPDPADRAAAVEKLGAN